MKALIVCVMVMMFGCGAVEERPRQGDITISGAEWARERVMEKEHYPRVAAREAARAMQNAIRIQGKQSETRTVTARGTDGETYIIIVEGVGH